MVVINRKNDYVHKEHDNDGDEILLCIIHHIIKMQQRPQSLIKMMIMIKIIDNDDGD